jgi:DNA-binding transcriptional ArsR family regulator
VHGHTRDLTTGRDAPIITFDNLNMIDRAQALDMENLAALFRALMHPTRLAILEMLRGEEECVCHMEAMLGLRQAYISQHLSVLREAGLVDVRREGWNVYYRAVRPEVFAVIDSALTLLTPPDRGRLKAETAALRQGMCGCPKCSMRSTPQRPSPSRSAKDVKIPTRPVDQPAGRQQGDKYG